MGSTHVLVLRKGTNQTCTFKCVQLSNLVNLHTPSVATVSGKRFTAVNQSWHLVKTSDDSSKRINKSYY